MKQVEYRYTGTVRLRGVHATNIDALDALQKAMDAAHSRFSILDIGHERFVPVDIGPTHIFSPSDAVRDTAPIETYDPAASEALIQRERARAREVVLGWLAEHETDPENREALLAAIRGETDG